MDWMIFSFFFVSSIYWFSSFERVSFLLLISFSLLSKSFVTLSIAANSYSSLNSSCLSLSI